MSNETRKPGSESGEGTGWVDAPDSPEVRERLAERVGVQQRKAAAGNAGLRGHIGHGTHEKQLLGAFGTLRIYNDPALDTMKAGPFAPGATYRVACRMSNGQPCPLSDQVRDLRGIVLKFFTPEGVETDLLMTNEGGRSHARNATEFMDVTDILVAGESGGGVIGALAELGRKLFSGALSLAAALHIGAVLGKEVVLHRVDSMTTEHYWGSVVAVGERAMKHSLHPHPTTVSGTQTNPDDADYLRNDLVNRLSNGPLRYVLSVQFFRDEAHTPMNDASVAWEAPLVPLGELEIPALPTEEEELLVNRMAFNPANGFAPLGITHARGDVYRASARNRGALSVEEIRAYFLDEHRRNT